MRAAAFGRILFSMPLPPEILEERKAGLIAALSDQFAQDQFSLEEYERLVEYAQKVETAREIAVLGRILQEHAAGAAPGEAYGNRRGEVHFGFLNQHFTILSSRRIDGLSAGNRDFTTILGDCQIFVAEADLVEEETVINANVLLGDTIIHVPENVRVTSSVFPLLGNVGIGRKKRNAPPDSPRSKRIVITGTAILGNITVKYRR